MAKAIKTKALKLKRDPAPPKAAAPKPLRGRGRPGVGDDMIGPEGLITMTLELLSKQAPGEITRASLARHANVDPGLIRYYFKNRDVLMRMVATQLTETLGARGLARAKPEESTPADLVSARAQTLLDFKLENPFYHHLMMEMAQSEDGESRALYHKIAGRAIERYREYLTAGQKDRTLRKVDEAFLYIAIVGLCDFFVIASPVLAPYLGKRTPERIQKDYGAFITDLILNGIRPR